MMILTEILGVHLILSNRNASSGGGKKLLHLQIGEIVCGMVKWEHEEKTNLRTCSEASDEDLHNLFLILSC